MMNKTNDRNEEEQSSTPTTTTFVSETLGGEEAVVPGKSSSPAEISVCPVAPRQDGDDDMKNDDDNDSGNVYRALVVDSGPIIRLTGLSALRGRAREYVTVPAVLEEIRDAKARQHLEQLPFVLQTREASAEGVQAVVDFARRTGDYASLSAVDVQVLGLLYDLEREGCGGDLRHVRKLPKRVVGVGKVEALGKEEETTTTTSREKTTETECSFDRYEEKTEEISIEKASVVTNNFAISDVDVEPKAAPSAPKTWAMLVSPAACVGTALDLKEQPAAEEVVDQALHSQFHSMEVSDNNGGGSAVEVQGQFCDPDDDGNDDELSDCNSDDGYADSSKEISDEECYVYIFDPEDLDERKDTRDESSQEEEFQSDFPSLAASLHVPHDENRDEATEEHLESLGEGLTKEQAERKRQEALRPVSKSGKLYNSFRKYGDIVKPAPAIRKPSKKPVEKAVEKQKLADDTVRESPNEGQSRIIGGVTLAGQGTEVVDDGEGWITCSKDIQTMKASGRIEPTQKNPTTTGEIKSIKPDGPPTARRAACATTDFAMQNVILQMNLELVSVDGIKVRRLKSWVTRCGSCFTVFADGQEDVGPHNTKRLFCSRCGSDFLQRVAASVDGKTGRLRLHLSKKHKNNLRGTKFSLPKPGTGNRFQGDLLLREDQLLMGAWNQKMKQRSGGKARAASESIFGSDLASNVGCRASIVKKSDITVGFGRRNPNASKYGRERRGKKKKSSDKACGLRRY